MSAGAVAPTQQQGQDTLVDKAWDAQERLEGRIANIGRGKYGRVVRMARKPTPDEYQKAALVSGAGMVLLGVMGFTIFILFHYIVDPLLHNA